ncbi:MAG: hypothetical protein QM768_21160 [Agriterribacter sp.]
MKHKFQFRYFLCALLFTAFFSCKKDGGTITDPGETISLYKTIAGKWNIHSLSGRIKDVHTANKIQDTDDLTSIEFLNDSTYIVVTGDLDVFTGSFKVTDSTSITLTGFGALSEIKIANEKINFKLFYNGNNITITANKADEIADSDNTRLLCRRWLLTQQEDGAGAYLDSDNADKITVIFSSSGTYLVQYLYKDALISADIANWEWHATQSNTFLYWWENDVNSKSPVVINELTKSVLKITETYTDDSETYSEKYILTPIEYSGRTVVSSGKISQKITNKLHKRGMFKMH